ncbi:MAG: dTMP kinase [Armatimonadota bacterium]|nr:dTMP kinase [Armatimonadota bacterium]
MPHARFITFEGIEGAGKTTLANHLAQWLQAQGIPVLLTREPGDSPIGESLRPLLLHQTIDPYTELFLFLADRREHTLRVIQPALHAGTWVLCDRYADSTLVYQGYGRGLDLALIRQLNDLATGGLTPDLTVLIDLPVEVALARANAPNRFEAETVAFHQRIREGYLQEAAHAPKRFLILDGQAPLTRLLEQVQRALHVWLPRVADAE